MARNPFKCRLVDYNGSQYLKKVPTHFKMDGPHGRHLCLVLVKALIALLRSAPSKLLDPPTRPAKS
jgi:hypothetical protein